MVFVRCLFFTNYECLFVKEVWITNIIFSAVTIEESTVM